jgi:hypothetical protein
MPKYEVTLTQAEWIQYTAIIAADTEEDALASAEEGYMQHETHEEDIDWVTVGNNGNVGGMDSIYKIEGKEDD